MTNLSNEEYKLEESIKTWNMVATALFLVLAVFGFFFLQQNNLLAREIPLFDFFILSLATFRLIRLFVYDNITLFIRESFMDTKRVCYAETGEEYVERVPSRNALKRTIDKLFGCPWCMGVWLAAVAVFFYFSFPEMWVIFLILAVAGLGSALQIFTNMIGWIAESKKMQVEKSSK